MDFLKDIHILLQQNECVIIPNLGGFITHYEPAKIDNTTDLFSPPYKGVVFNHRLTQNDGLLIHHLMKKHQKTYEFIANEIAQFVEQIKFDIAQNKSITIEKVGTLSKNKEGFYHFQQDKSNNLLQNSFALYAFHSPAINKKARLQKERSLTLTTPLKWAAILIPFLFLGYWFYSNNNLHQEISQYYTSIFPIQSKNYERPILPIASIKNYNLNHKTSLIINNEEIAFRKTNKWLMNSIKQQIKKKAPYPIERYHIISSVFKKEVNAEKYITKMSTYGYDPFIIGKSASGLIRVCIASAGKKKQALEILKEVRENHRKDAWIYYH